MNETSPIPEMPPPDMSLSARLLNILAEPAEVFDSIKAAPARAANWFVPVMALLIVSWLGAWIIFSQPSIKNQLSEITDQAIQRQVDRGKLTEKQAEGARQAAEKIGGIGMKISAVGAPLFVAFGTPFWGGLIVWLAGTKALRGQFTYMRAVEVSGLASMIAVLGEIVRVLLVVVLGNVFAAPSLALVLKEPDPQSGTYAILSLFNLFLLWELGVRSVGLARLSGTSFGKAAAWVFGVWAGFTGSLIGLGQGLRLAFGG